MNLCVRSSHESADSTAIAPNAPGLRDARFQEPKPPDEKPNTPRLLAADNVRQVLSMRGHLQRIASEVLLMPAVSVSLRQLLGLGQLALPPDLDDRYNKPTTVNTGKR